ncbi:MAG: glycosyltransferase family A protein [Anaerolineaceae bacterium]|nr:glycosyltransferase family A protein [Anaerolineaceae bacterium]MDD4043286.1 glycosyltransferase family A protein [Anaerolineaceae bacterium]MDD4577184.1 glycosyltransferase family A protein [Anaerolineaceae bacterium]
MARLGTNPSRGQQLGFTPPRVSVAVLVYAPNQAGYFQHRLDVTRLTLESIITNTPEPFELLVFDNGSCLEMTDFLKELHQAGKIDTLVLSQQNIGKLNALWRIANLAQGEVIAYSDDDVYHLSGWLPSHLQILDTYPNVGAVTGFYIKQRVVMSSESTLQWVKGYETEHPDLVERGNLIPRKWEEEYMDNSGRSEERYQGEIAGVEDILVDYQGVKAWVSAHHFQVLSPKKVLLEVLAEMLEDGWSDLMMGRMVEMDDRMDAKGYLRLTTHEQTMRLLGNAIDDEVQGLAARDGISTQAALSNAASEKRTGIWNNKLIQKLAQRTINWLYRGLHENRRNG